MIKMTRFGNLTMEDTNVVCIERIVNWECRTREKNNALLWEQTTECAVRLHQPRGHRLTSRPSAEIQSSQNLRAVITYIEGIQYLLQLRFTQWRGHLSGARMFVRDAVGTRSALGNIELDTA